MHHIHIAVNRKNAPQDIHSAMYELHNTGMAKNQRKKHYLREWRKLKPGRTLDMVAEELHMSQPQLSRIERGESPYNQDLLDALAELYGTTPASLIMRDPTKDDALWSLFDSIPVDKRETIKGVVEAILRTGTDG